MLCWVIIIPGAWVESAAGQLAGVCHFLLPSSLVTSPYTTDLSSPCSPTNSIFLPGTPLLFWNLSLQYVSVPSLCWHLETLSLLNATHPAKPSTNVAPNTHSSRPNSVTAFDLILFGVLTCILQFVHFQRHWARSVLFLSIRTMIYSPLCSISLWIYSTPSTAPGRSWAFDKQFESNAL